MIGFRFRALQCFGFVERPRKKQKVHMFVRGFAALVTRRNVLEQHRERFFQHASLVLRIRKQIGLRVADDLDVEPCFLFAFPACCIFRQFVFVDVAAGRHPTLEPPVPHQQDALLRIDDECRCGELSLHGINCYTTPLPSSDSMVLVNDNSTALSIGDPMPEFTLPATDGLEVDAQIIKDPVIAVVFTCNHCPYAQAYEDRLIALAKRFDQEGVQFILINSNDATDYPDDSFDSMKVRHDEKAFPFPYCHDESQEVAKAYGALCTPHCFVFDRERKLRYKGRVDDNWRDPSAVTQHNLRDALEALVKGEEPPVAEANAIGCSIKWKQ